MKFRRFIKNYDMFGYAIQLRFDGKGDTHRTLIGGIISICVYLIMVAYTCILAIKLATNGADKNNSVL